MLQRPNRISPPRRQTPPDWRQCLIWIEPSSHARWAGCDYNAAGQWLNTSAGPAPWRDQAVALPVEKIAPLDAAAAKAWAATITDPAVKQTLK